MDMYSENFEQQPEAFQQPPEAFQQPPRPGAGLNVLKPGAKVAAKPAPAQPARAPAQAAPAPAAKGLATWQIVLGLAVLGAASYYLYTVYYKKGGAESVTPLTPSL
jgi:hypothetical protein